MKFGRGQRPVGLRRGHSKRTTLLPLLLLSLSFSFFPLLPLFLLLITSPLLPPPPFQCIALTFTLFHHISPNLPFHPLLRHGLSIYLVTPWNYFSYTAIIFNSFVYYLAFLQIFTLDNYLAYSLVCE